MMTVKGKTSCLSATDAISGTFFLSHG